MGFLSRVKATMKESETAQAIHAIPLEDRPVLVYAEDDYTWNQLEGYISELMHTFERPIVYVTSDPEDPRFEQHDSMMSVFCIKETIAKFLPSIDSPVFLTTMPDLDRFHIKRPAGATCVYLFHSLVSTHVVYREGAFDAYDVFLCVGPHQKEELSARFAAIGKTDYELYDVGYYKLDRISAAFDSYDKVHPTETTILIAPSWSPDNLLATVGPALISSISGAGYRTVVRPHPAFFESIYPEGRSIVAGLERQFSATPNVIFETSVTTENSFLEADPMVSDWSGAAFEYAFGTERPVLFVDVPRKVMNDRWEDIDLPAFEDRARSEVGVVISMEDTKNAADHISSLIEHPKAFSDQIIAVRDREIFNFRRAAHVGAAVVDGLIG